MLIKKYPKLPYICAAHLHFSCTVSTIAVPFKNDTDTLVVSVLFLVEILSEGFEGRAVQSNSPVTVVTASDQASADARIESLALTPNPVPPLIQSCRWWYLLFIYPQLI